MQWQWPWIAVEIATDFHRFPWLKRRSLPRTEPRHVPWPPSWHLPWKCHEPWRLPWKPAAFHGSTWQHPRKSTEVPRSLPRTSAKKSNNNLMCIRVNTAENTCHHHDMYTVRSRSTLSQQENYLSTNARFYLTIQPVFFNGLGISNSGNGTGGLWVIAASSWQGLISCAARPRPVAGDGEPGATLLPQANPVASAHICSIPCWPRRLVCAHTPVVLQRMSQHSQYQSTASRYRSKRAVRSS